VTILRIDPITRLEGHGKIEILLDADGEVSDVRFQVPELRGFERFCVGRPVEEMPVLTSRICGVCPEAHHLAATKALDDLFGTPPPPAARKLRELFYQAFFVTDHATHFWALGGPDLIVGPDAPPAERNLLGVVAKVGLEAGKEVIACRARNHEAIRLLGGRSINPCAGLPGGWSRSLREEDRRDIAGTARKNVEFARMTLGVFRRIVLDDPVWRKTLESEAWTHRTYSMGTVDAANRVSFHDGSIRVVDPDGVPVARFEARDWAEHLAERVESWSYLKFPYLRKIGWKGFVDGVGSGVYTATPLSRLNAADGMSTPGAQEEFERFFATLGSGSIDGRFRPVHFRLATHWARLVELLAAAERMVELAEDPEITSPDVRTIPSGAISPKGGTGSVEAPRGTLIHHYEADGRGRVTRVDLLSGTTNNHAAIAMSIRRAAESLIRKGVVASEGILNRIEMAFRLYDPCLSCATHSLPGRMPLEVQLVDAGGETIRRFARE
jgi:F420-non-reducing hydrogenase large subunit